jgi:hypothetical protein
LTCLLVVGTLTCGSIAATAAGSYYSKADQTLCFGDAVTFEGENYYHKLHVGPDGKSIVIQKDGCYTVNYSVTGSLATAPGSWSVGLYLNDSFTDVPVDIAGNSGLTGNVTTTSSSVILHLLRGNILTVKNTTTADILLSGSVSGNVDLRNSSATISLVKVELADIPLPIEPVIEPIVIDPSEPV